MRSNMSFPGAEYLYHILDETKYILSQSKKLDKESGYIEEFGSDVNNPVNRALMAMFDLYFDDDGTIWAASGFAGVVLFDLRINPFTEYDIGPFEDDPYKFEATAFEEDQNGNLWVGTGNAGLLEYDPEMNLINRYSWDPDDPNSLSY